MISINQLVLLKAVEFRYELSPPDTSLEGLTGRRWALGKRLHAERSDLPNGLTSARTEMVALSGDSRAEGSRSLTGILCKVIP